MHAEVMGALLRRGKKSGPNLFFSLMSRVGHAAALGPGTDKKG